MNSNNSKAFFQVSELLHMLLSFCCDICIYIYMKSKAILQDTDEEKNIYDSLRGLHVIF